jgi:trehalose/maltose hydrolase-like predicted phosphorylase
MLVDIGKFWLSRLDGLNPETNTYDIIGVMPPDEDHAFVNNSAFTNVAAGLAMYTAKLVIKYSYISLWSPVGLFRFTVIPTYL